MTHRILLVLSIVIQTSYVVAQNRVGLDSERQTANFSRSGSQVPLLIKFSGVLKDDSGSPREGLIGITFALYKEQEGGAPLWLETQSVRVDSLGHYAVRLGVMHSEGLPAELFASGEARWISATTAEDYVSPRFLLVSVPYALKAMDAETLGGRPVTDFVLAEQLDSGPRRRPDDPKLRFPIPWSDGTHRAVTFESTIAIGPSFISRATTGPPMQVGSTALNTNFNADLLHGLPDSAFAKLGVTNSFSGKQVFGGGLVLPPMGQASANGSNGVPSNPLDFEASLFDPVAQTPPKTRSSVGKLKP
jgi:hypothetical protein